MKKYANSYTLNKIIRVRKEIGRSGDREIGSGAPGIQLSLVLVLLAQRGVVVRINIFFLIFTYTAAILQ